MRPLLAVLIPLALTSGACLEVIQETGPVGPTSSSPPAAADHCCYVPTPDPTAAPRPTPTPNSDPGHIPQNVPSNTTSIARVDLKVYYVDCDGQVMDDSAYATHAPVGCRVHFDATPQDHMGRATLSHDHKWYLGGPAQFGAQSSLTPTAVGQRPGVVTAQVWVDGVMSDSISVTFY